MVYYNVLPTPQNFSPKLVINDSMSNSSARGGDITPVKAIQPLDKRQLYSCLKKLANEIKIRPEFRTQCIQQAAACEDDLVTFQDWLEKELHIMITEEESKNLFLYLRLYNWGSVLIKDNSIVSQIFEVPSPMNYTAWHTNIENMQIRNQFRSSLRPFDQLPNKSPMKYRMSPLKQEMKSPEKKLQLAKSTQLTHFKTKQNSNSPQKYHVEKRSNHSSKLEQLQEKYLSRQSRDYAAKITKKAAVPPPPPPPPRPLPTATATYASRRLTNRTPPVSKQHATSRLASRPLPKLRLKSKKNSQLEFDHNKVKRKRNSTGAGAGPAELALDVPSQNNLVKEMNNQRQYSKPHRRVYTGVMNDDLTDDEEENPNASEKYYNDSYQNHSSFNPRQAPLMQKDADYSLKSLPPTHRLASPSASVSPSTSIHDSCSPSHADKSTYVATDTVPKTKRISMSIQIPRVTAL
mmetsp:Transcript_24768/g.41894  ORF Transcript_24768/g.41894 Transcript_24768/m.41894 type:complete len:462 (+) Transcript_24768:139-1524(+)|eukprot:CAMPEP_0114432740 /NCGR_PEP_ID=MMETSP0103-20121206/11320_1 /TAXON_ID=37642 ORGANISM="Paraphysomonas imperforata, Strain PA2" /NCGR_SAMPLE_ID=MMETSP0103 /ASSEMBLY_ACC=CAM_ASM_000201 /LENGTH=461 /DNA_ID=CAMNT_0001602443 /DNA_START=134 /DNA_END=1519 /DNA_ORIENTATION=-